MASFSRKEDSTCFQANEYSKTEAPVKAAMMRMQFFFFILLGSMFIYPISCHMMPPRVGIYELRRGNFSIKLTNYGATVMSLVLPDRNGTLADVVLGYDTVEEYTNDTTYFGAIVGRVANRIKGAEFFLNGRAYKLPVNEGNSTTLHGGPKGFSDVVWSVKNYRMDSHITFVYRSFDGEEGFPGFLIVTVTYKFVEWNNLMVTMKATPINKPTPVNLASHIYWNLGGHNSGDILSEIIQLYGSMVTPVDENLIPTGEITSVHGTPYDFLTPHEIKSLMKNQPDGYDINYVVDNFNHSYIKLVAVASDAVSGRKMEVWSNQLGVQFYTGNMITEVKGKNGTIYKKHAGFCLETQGFPNSINYDYFPCQFVNPGQHYEHVMIYKFSTQ